MRVLLTVPHSFCISDRIRDCDRRALPSAKILNQVLNEHNISTKLYDSTIYRSISDLNRYESKDTQWSKKLNHKKPKYDFVLDVHSFPNTSRSFGTVNGKVPKFVTLDHPNPNWELVHIVQDVIPESKALTGGVTNYIITNAKNMGIPAVLLEFNEDITYLSNDEIREIGKSIVIYLENLFSSKRYRKMPKHQFTGDEAFKDFLKKPDKYQLDEDDLEGYESSGMKGLPDHKRLEWVFSSADAWCGLEGYYDDGIVMIESFKANPEGQGYGKACLKYLSEKLDQHRISLMVIDELDETYEFWSKMREAGYVF